MHHVKNATASRAARDAEMAKYHSGEVSLDDALEAAAYAALDATDKPVEELRKTDEYVPAYGRYRIKRILTQAQLALAAEKGHGAVLNQLAKVYHGSFKWGSSRAPTIRAGFRNRLSTHMREAFNGDHHCWRFQLDWNTMVQAFGEEEALRTLHFDLLEGFTLQPGQHPRALEGEARLAETAHINAAKAEGNCFNTRRIGAIHGGVNMSGLGHRLGSE